MDKTNKDKINEFVTITNNELKSLNYSEDDIQLMNHLMLRILIYLFGQIGASIYHKNTAQTLRSLANIIDLMVEKNENINRHNQ